MTVRMFSRKNGLRMPFFKGREYYWIRFYVGDKMGVLGPYKDEKEANNNALDQLKAAKLFNIYPLKTRDRAEASKMLHNLYPPETDRIVDDGGESDRKIKRKFI